MNSRTFAALALAFSGLFYASTGVIAAELATSTEKPTAGFHKTAHHKKAHHRKVHHPKVHHKAHHKVHHKAKPTERVAEQTEATPP
jgi:hypothetical protein